MFLEEKSGQPYCHPQQQIEIPAGQDAVAQTVVNLSS
jgi:hypothetical protein